MSEPQSFATHGRLHPIFHFVLLPLLLINLIVSIVWVVRDPSIRLGLEHRNGSCVLSILALLVRSNPMKVQDRVIRLEERLRLYALLPESLRRRIPELTEDQLIGLRFAPDEELPALAERAMNEKLSRKEIKKAINQLAPG